MTNSTVSDGYSSVPMYILYVCQGLVIGGGNLVIALCILRYEALKSCKEYIIMLGLSLADALNMIAFLVAGLYRLWLVLRASHNILLTSWECALKPQNFIFPLSFLQANFMLCLVSIDRLISVLDPLGYIGFTTRYAYSLLLVAFSYGLLNEALYLVVAYRGRYHPAYIPASCITSLAVENGPEWYKFHFGRAPTFFAFLSVLLYGLVIINARHKISPVNDREKQRQLGRQRHITNTLAWSCGCTLVLFCLPHLMGNFILKQGYPSVSLLFYILTTLNPLCNVFIYQIRHQEIRQALKGLLKCKQMPIDVRMWKSVNKQPNQQIRADGVMVL